MQEIPRDPEHQDPPEASAHREDTEHCKDRERPGERPEDNQEATQGCS